MGKCLEMIHTHFPWHHVVNGRPQHPQRQGMIKRSHGPFKKALRQLLKQHDTEDWVPHIYSAQCAVNNRAMRSRGNLTPYSLYFGSRNRTNYGVILGPSYKLAKTEYGLHITKMVLIRLKKLVPNTAMSQRDVEGLIRTGDELFEAVSRSNEPLDWKDVKRLVAESIRRHGVEIATDDEFEDDDTPSGMESINEDSNEDIDEENTGVATATDTVGATAAANSIAAFPSGTGTSARPIVTATATPPSGSATADRPSGTATATPTGGTGTAHCSSGTATAAPTSGCDRPSGTATAAPTSGSDRPSGTATAPPTSETAVTTATSHDGDDTGKEDIWFKASSNDIYECLLI
jgi:hypothetical protein